MWILALILRVARQLILAKNNKVDNNVANINNYLECAKFYPKHYANLMSYNTHNNPMR